MESFDPLGRQGDDGGGGTGEDEDAGAFEILEVVDESRESGCLGDCLQAGHAHRGCVGAPQAWRR